jgi:hypothetical protein
MVVMNGVTVTLILVVAAIVVVFLAGSVGPTAGTIEHLKLATRNDLKMANAHVAKHYCDLNGDVFTLNGDGSYDCRYTPTTCESNSVYPMAENQNGIYQYWDGNAEKCYWGYDALRKNCETLGMQWNHDTQTCSVTPQYCESQFLGYKDGDCWLNPITDIDEKIFGTTLGRAISNGGLGGFINKASLLAAGQGNVAGVLLSGVNTLVSGPWNSLMGAGALNPLAVASDALSATGK